MACNKIEREPKVETGEITDITTINASAAGNIIDLGDDGIIDYGHCWSTSINPSINNFKTSFGTISRTGPYTSILQSLQPGTKYYINTYVENANREVYYGNEASFTTDAISLPTITTTPVTSITLTTAVSGGNVTSDGGATVTARGVCWSTHSNPTISDQKTSDGGGSGTFTSNITGLTGNTTYYVKAYATNSEGTGYGEELSFKTSSMIPMVSTATPTATSTTTGSGGGTVINDNGSPVTARGVCWSTNPNPTIAGDKTNDGTGTGVFTSTITELNPNTTYHVRAYATNSVGSSYGSDMTFTTDPLTVDDNDGNTYDVIRIGTQVWMAENLKTTTFNDDTPISQVTGSSAWSNLTSQGYCWYNNNETNKDIYGALYNWYAVNTNKLCPDDWHVPSDAEWTILTTYLGGENVAGGILKETGTSHWLSPNIGATNEYDFSALPGGGRRGDNGIFYDIAGIGYWWSSTEYASAFAWGRDIFWNATNVLRDGNHEGWGFSIRCLKD